METRSTASFGLSSKYPRRLFWVKDSQEEQNMRPGNELLNRQPKAEKRTEGPCQHLDLNQGLFGLAAAKLAPQRNVLTTALCWLCLDVSENVV